MKAIMLMFDSLNRHYLPNYGCDWTVMPNFCRLAQRTLTFDNFYAGSLPCMPARRELHTGRYNFLHSSWSPLQPYDDSVIQRLKEKGVYTHVTTDHFHYWEAGGSCYLTKFDSYEMHRGQQGDPWIGQVPWPEFPETLCRRQNGQNWRHDWINRAFLKTEAQMPQTRTMDSGLDFIERNAKYDDWYLQIEIFDPHEPFYTQENYKKLYPHDYHGKNLDWPDYGKNEYGPEATRHVRYEYAALLSMCDHNLGRLLDKMDQLDMWRDTMLIVNTDHGFMLGEKEWMGKNIQPMYQEIVHLPFFLYDPRCPDAKGERREALAQTVDIVPTLAEFFQAELPECMDGRSLTPVIRTDEAIRDAALFGVFGGHVNITDGRYVYMKAPVSEENTPLFEYTDMPCHMREPFTSEELSQAELLDGFPHMKGSKVMRIPAKTNFSAYRQGTLLYDLWKDPVQNMPFREEDTEKRLESAMVRMMKENEAPEEQYERVGLSHKKEHH
nr:sulfatase [uncultured Acetatifactor sp.]